MTGARPPAGADAPQPVEPVEQVEPVELITRVPPAEPITRVPPVEPVEPVVAVDLSPPSDPIELVLGEDGRSRCAWSAGDAEYRRYHDEEWGRPLHGDRQLFEKLSLEAFQSGLSWITILRRRDGFRAAFRSFDIDAVAAMGEADVERLLLDRAIIRNRAKIRATIENARVVRGLIIDSPGALDELMWSFAPAAPRPRPTRLRDIAATTPESAALSTELRRLGLRFVGPTTMHALMQSAGMVDDHLAGCWRSGRDRTS